MTTLPSPCPLRGLRNKRGRIGEDALPNWVRKEIAATNPAPFSLRGKEQGTPFRVRSRLPCVDCNGWMNLTFEQPAMPLLRPIFRGMAAQLNRDQQQVIASWSYKTLLMMSLATNRGLTQAVPEHELGRFRQSARPPQGLFLGIAAIDFRGERPGLPQSPMALPEPPPTETMLKAAAILPQGFSMAINEFGIQTSFFLGPQSGPLRSIAEDKGLLIRIWPPRQNNIEWPPRLWYSPALWNTLQGGFYLL